MAKVIIMGTKDFAELAYYYLSHDTLHEVIAFSVGRDYFADGAEFCGLPIIAFEDVENILPPCEYKFFAPMSPNKMNRTRERECISYVSSKATINDNLIGENCFILEDNTIQPFTTIGNNVVLWSGNHIGHHGVIKDHVMFTSHVVMSGHCEIGCNSFFGVNATLRDGLRIAEGTFVAMASAVMHDTDPWGAYKGNPAEKLSVPSTRIKL
jgi:acetyltransferase-like isoleucine patch superfamily enzyme